MGVAVKLSHDLRRARPALGAMPVQAALEWAFRRECAQLDLPPRSGDLDEIGFGFGMEYVLLQRAKLGGVRIDTSIGRSEPHEDAETIAAIVANLADIVGGRFMATVVAGHARAGTTPDWLPGVKARVVPVEWRTNSHGTRAATEVIGHYRAVSRGRKVEREILWCPVTFDPHPHLIEQRRTAYIEWWFALSEIRRNLQACGMLREISITDAMPPRAPWKKSA